MCNLLAYFSDNLQQYRRIRKTARAREKHVKVTRVNLHGVILIFLLEFAKKKKKAIEKIENVGGGKMSQK